MSNKLLDFQKKVGAITKDSTNPFFKSNYFDINKLIEEIKPILNELELILLQPLVTGEVNGKLAIKTIVIDAETDKELISGCAVLPENPDPQKMGSIITYYRRYAIQSLLFLQAEDDDGNMATQNKEVKKEATKPLSDYQKICLALKKKNPNLKSLSDYQDACYDITGFPLLKGHYQDIINLLK